MRTSAVVLALLSLGGCAEKNRDAIARMVPEYAPLRARLAKVGEAIGALQPNLSPQKPPLSVPPAYDAGAKHSNTDVMALEQLADVYAKPKMDLMLGGDLSRALKYTGDHNPAASSMLEQRHGKETEAWMRAALETRYLVIYRNVMLLEPTVKDDHTFTPGMAGEALYLVDLKNGDQVTPLGVAVGHTDSARSTLLESTQSEVQKRLTEATGGRFVFK
jgi:hypothetical protein